MQTGHSGFIEIHAADGFDVSTERSFLRYRRPYADVLDHLIAREKLGSTGLGQGIAIPHCRIANCPQPLGTLVTLQEPIDFDAPDDAPVDLLFVLLVPQEADQQHLDILATIARLFSQPDFCTQLRAAPDTQTLFDLASNQTT